MHVEHIIKVILQQHHAQVRAPHLIHVRADQARGKLFCFVFAQLQIIILVYLSQ